MEIINNTTRKRLRYLMFAKKNNIELVNAVSSSLQTDEDIINYYESHENFTNWNDFETRWDIGFGDDLIAKTNRGEKWFLFDGEKTEIINRPSDYWEVEAARKNTTTYSLFVKECSSRGIKMNEFFSQFF